MVKASSRHYLMSHEPEGKYAHRPISNGTPIPAAFVSFSFYRRRGDRGDHEKPSYGKTLTNEKPMVPLKSVHGDSDKGTRYETCHTPDHGYAFLHRPSHPI